MNKFHINLETGVASMCRARKGKCPFGNIDEHFQSKEEANAMFEAMQNGSFQSMNESAGIARDYAIWALLNDHLHNATDVGNHAEEYYYSSPAGLLELIRRVAYERGSSTYTPHSELLLKLNSHDNYERVKPEVSTRELLQFKQLEKRGNELLSTTAQADEVDLDVFNRVDKRVGAYLIEKSSEWLNKLSIEDQEVISHMTSNGFYYTNEALSENPVPSRETMRDVVYHRKAEIAAAEELIGKDGDDEAYYEAYYRVGKDFSHDFTSRLKSAVERAPKLANPIKIYRGVNTDEVNELLGADNKTRNASVDELLSSKNFKKDVSHARITKIPLSASANPLRSLSFTRGDFAENEKSRKYLFEIETDTVASPVAVSAWGVGEAEVFTSHAKKYELIGAYKAHDEDAHSELIVLKLKAN